HALDKRRVTGSSPVRPIFFDLQVLTRRRTRLARLRRADGDDRKPCRLFQSTRNGLRFYSTPMNNSIRSATLSFGVFLNAPATFAGQWTEVPGGAAPHPSALYGIA